MTSVAVIAHGRTLADMQFTPEETPYSFVAMVPQDVTERLLVEELQRKGGRIEYETTFVSANQQDDGVVAMVDHRGEPIQIRASFVVGCDGAHSAVRQTLKLPLEGGEYEDSFMLADIETNETLPANQMQLCPSEFGPVAIFPMSATRRRVVATIEHTGRRRSAAGLGAENTRSTRAKRDRSARPSLEQLFSDPSPARTAASRWTYLHRRRCGSHSQPVWRARDEYWTAGCLESGLEARPFPSRPWQRALA